MSTSRRFRPAGRRWVAVFLVLLIVLGMNVVAAAAPAKPMTGIIIESPAASTVSGTITVQAQVPGNPKLVQYKIDGRPPVKMTKTPEGKWSAAWDTRTVPYGQHTVMVFASGLNYRPLSATVKVTVDNHNPSITVLKPAEGATVGGSRVALEVRVNDAIPGTAVTYTAGDGTPAPMTRNLNSGIFEATWDTRSLPDGDVTLSFHATDPTGMTADATRTATIQQPVGQESGDFTHSRGDLAGRAYTAENLGSNLTALWTKPSSLHSSRLAIYNGVLYAASTTSPGKLSAMDAATGRILWEKSLANTPGPVAVGPNAAYVTPYNSQVVAYKHDGSLLWQSTVTAATPPILTPEGVFVGDLNGKVYALDPLTGATLWSVQTNGSNGFGRDPMPVYAEGKLYMPGWYGVQVVDTVSRQMAFSISGSGDDGLAWDNGVLYVVGGSVSAYNATTGEQLWVSQASHSFDSPLAIGNGILIVGEDADQPKLYALDTATGETLWSQVLDTYGTSYGKPVIADNLVYMGAYFGGLKVYDLMTGAYQTTLLPGVKVRNTPIPYGGVLYVPDAQWGTYALKRP